MSFLGLKIVFFLGKLRLLCDAFAFVKYEVIKELFVLGSFVCGVLIACNGCLFVEFIFPAREFVALALL